MKVPDQHEPPDWLFQLMNHVEGQVMFGDSKAGQLLAADSILLAVVALLAKDFRNEVSSSTLILAGLAAILLVASLGFVLAAIAPSQVLLMGKRPSSHAIWSKALGQSRHKNSDQGKSLVQFANIASMEVDEYIDRATSVTPDDVQQQIIRCIWGKAGWVRHKFLLLDYAVKTVITALAVAALCIPAELLSALL